jgi:anaerobic selenocysteine-containing dehydrogenase
MNEDLSKHPIFAPLGQIEGMLEAQSVPLDLRRAAAPILMACMGFAQQHPAAIQRAGIQENGKGLAVSLFERIVSSPSGAIISMHEYEDTFSFIRHADGKIHLNVDLMMQLMDELRQEADHGPVLDQEYPFILSAGERRSSNATTTYRNPAWRKTDSKGSMIINPEDAKRLGLSEGDLAICESRQGTISVYARIDDGIRAGCVSVPHGFGLKYAESDGKRTMHGPRINLLTASLHCDPLTKTPYHKNVQVRIRKAV